MDLYSYHQADRHIIDWLADAIYSLINNRGVPTSLDDMWELVTELIPLIQEARTQSYKVAIAHIHSVATTHGVQITPAPQKPYYPNAAWKMLARALGWNPTRDPIPGRITDYDATYQQQLADNIIPFPPDPTDPVLVDKVARRVAAGATRHARAAGRDAIADTADRNEAKPAKRRVVVQVDNESDARRLRDELSDPRKVAVDQYVRPAKGGGVVLGWARVLTGAESCAFCAMLASRGPVYEESTVLTSEEGKAYHDHCDCKAVLVIKGRPWEGEAEYKALKTLWNDARDHPTKEELDNDLEMPIDRFSSRYRQLAKENPEVFATFKDSADDPGQRPEEIAPDFHSGREEHSQSPRPVEDSGSVSEDGGMGLAGSAFEQPNSDGTFTLPAKDGFPELRLSTLYPYDLDEYPRLEAPETMEQAAVQVSRVNSFANCVRATAATMMRMRGYDIYPYATLYSGSGGGLQILEALKMWETPDGEPVKIIETTAQEWKDALGKMPDGYGIFSFQIIDSAQRHVVLWKKNDGKTSFIDAQLGVEIELEGEYGVEDAPVILARLDNAVPVGVLLTDVIQPFGKM